MRSSLSLNALVHFGWIGPSHGAAELSIRHIAPKETKHPNGEVLAITIHLFTFLIPFLLPRLPAVR